MAEMASHVDVFDRQDPAWFQGGERDLQSRQRFRQMRQDEARVSHVRRRNRPCGCSVGGQQLEVSKPALLGFSSDNRQLGLVHVQADDAAVRTDAFGEFERDLSAAATCIDNGPALHDSNAIEQLCRRRSDDPRENREAIPPLAAAMMHISADAICHDQPRSQSSSMRLSPAGCVRSRELRAVYLTHDYARLLPRR